MKDQLSGKDIQSELNKRRQISETEAEDLGAAKQALKAKEADEAVKRYKKLLAKTAFEEQIIEHFEDHLKGMLDTGKLSFKFAKPERLAKGKHGQPEEANLVISDSHVGKRVEPKHTLGFGNYNPRIFLERLSHLEHVVTRLLQQNISNPIQTLNILFLGDLVEGTLNHGEEIPGRDEFADQVLVASMAFFQFIARVSRLVPVRCRGVGGNHCVDTETEIYTRRGWLKYSDVEVGDECIGLEGDGRTARWQKVKEVIAQPQVDRMVFLKNREFNFRGTEHHRFYYKINGHPMLNQAMWSEIKSLPISIPAAGFCPGDGSGVPDHLIEACGWILTDGYISKDRKQICIYQNKSKSHLPRAALVKSGFAFKEYERTRKNTAICGVVLKKEFNTSVTFRICTTLSREFLKITGLKKGALPAWVWNMTHDQFDRFLKALEQGDGTRMEGDAGFVLYGKSKEWLGEVQALCALHGRRASISSYQKGKQFKLNVCDNTQYIKLGLRATNEISESTGETVWCVVTETGNFFCRRGGRSYFTGNSRLPSQKRSPTHGRWSNFDFVVMGQIQQMMMVSGLDNAEFVLEENSFQVFNEFDWRIKIGHGDHLKGGDRALGVPAHAIGREINATTQRYTARLAGNLQNGSIKNLDAVRQQLPPDYYIVGDKHRHISVATARGRFLVNGAFFQDDEYALTANFSPDRPSQLFFGIHPRIGKSWSYDLMLDMAPSLDKIPYQLPARLADKLAKYF